MTVRALRVALLVTAAVVLQAGVFPDLRLLGVVPDLGLLVAVSVSYRDGPEAGAVVGFAAGLGYDLFLQTPLGLSALSYALTAYLVGVLRAAMLRSPRWASLGLGAAAGVVGGLLFAGIGIVSGVDRLLAVATLSVVGRSALYDVLLAPFVFAIVQRVLGPRDAVAVGAW